MPSPPAAFPSASVVGDGTSTAFSSSRRYSCSEFSSHTPARHTQSGYTGMKVSGNTMSRAPPDAASLINETDFATVASRSRKTGAAWTAAARTFSMDPPLYASDGLSRGISPT